MKQKLISLGLNENQATIRLAVWQRGLSPASHIGNITNMERTHAYKILQQLVKKGLLATSVRASTTYFYVPDKHVLHSLVEASKHHYETQKNALQTLENELDTLIDPELSLVPPTQQRTGTQGVQAGLRHCIASCQRDHIRQITIFGSKTLESIATSTATLSEKRSEFFDMIDTANIHIEGYEGTGILLLEHVNRTLHKNEIQTLPTGSHALQVIIAGPHLYYLFARREPVMIQISSAEMAELMRILFVKSVK